LPFEVITHRSYSEGDENKLGGFNGKPIYLEGGKTLNATREIVTGLDNWPKDKKFIKETKIIEYGGWGIRKTFSGKGTAYNVKGKNGLQLVFKNGDRLLIGTQKAEELKETLLTLGKINEV
jgi:hypothetical protein